MKIVGVHYQLVLEFIVTDLEHGGKSNKNLSWVTEIQVKVTLYYYIVSILKYFSKNFSCGVIQVGRYWPLMGYSKAFDIPSTFFGHVTNTPTQLFKI